jgi:capsular exopolysaccharide synthesis family protein
MTLNDIISPLIKWWWLLLASTLIAALSSYYVSSQQPALYQSSTTLMIGSAIDNPNPTSGELYLEQQLAGTYTNIANQNPIREATMEALGLTWLPEYYVSTLTNSQLIQIVVIDTVPERAQVVAQELANQLILQSPSGLNQQDQERKDFIEGQLNALQEQIVNTQTEIETLQLQLGELNSASQIADTQNQIRALTSVLGTLQSNYGILLSNTAQGATNTLSIIETAAVSNQPVGPNILMTVILSSDVGFSLAAAGAYLLEYLDKSIKNAEEASELVEASVIGYIPKFPKNETAWDYVSQNPRSPISDAFRTIRTNLEFSKAVREIKTILVTGTSVAEGKSTIASNLALIFAQSDKNVLLLDADLRKSAIQEILGLHDNKGLSNLISNQAELSETILPINNGKVKLIPAGQYPPNPAELLGSVKFDKLLEHLKSNTDIIIIDGPPLSVTDASILASKVDGIILVVRPGHTNRDAIKALIKPLELISTPILGIISNRDKNRPSYYADYYYTKSSE